jgi:hypothetical protein
VPHLDKTMADVLGLEHEVSDSDLAARMAELAGANAPVGQEEERIWIELEKSIEAKLVQTPRRSVEDAEAGEYVVSHVLARTSWPVWVQAFGGDPDDATYDSERNPDTRLRRFIMREIAPALAKAGLFRLI